MSKKKREKKLQARNKALARKREEDRIASPPPVPFGGTPPMFRPSLGDIEAPEGFRPLPMIQAMMKFADPIMQYLEDGTLDDPNDGINIAMEIWNSTLPLAPDAQKKPRKELVALIHNKLQLSNQEAEEFLDSLLQRKEHLFPEEIQPEPPSMTMFMRKEVEYIIKPFDETQLPISDAVIPPDDEDEEMLDALRQMDELIDEDADYEEWEDHFFTMQELCCNRYYAWLQAKGVPPEQGNFFPFCIEIYLNFIYQYDEGELREVSFGAIEEFLLDHLVRKVMEEPPQFVYWPPAIRLFYTFLAEKGYLDDPEDILGMFDEVEEDFIELLKEIS